MQQTYVVIPRNCTGCRTCELACAMVKGKDGTLGQPRIRVYPEGEERYMQMTCLQCVDAACAKVCPTNTLRRHQDTRAIEVIEGRCIGCGACQAACPFGHITFGNDKSLPLKCDLCSGDPACAKFCPHDALEMR